jgi:hypothetical protein
MNKKTTALLVALAMVLANLPLAAAGAPLGGAQSVVVNAELSPSGNPPAIEKIFVLDRNSTGDLTETGDELHLIPGTQILPNPGVGMSEVETHFWKFVIVSDPNGRDDIATVYEKLLDLDGITPMTSEVIATDITNTPAQDEALLAALNAGLITQAEYDECVWMLDPLKQQARIYVVENTLTNHDEPGDYTVYFKAVDTSGGFVEGTGQFQYLAIKALELDFSTINYGPITIGVPKWVAGDDVWGTADRPTLKNQGNIPFQVAVNASDLIGINPPQQIIPAEALSVELLGQHVLSAGQGGPGLATPIILDGYLKPCTPTQISFDIVAPVGSSANTYAGDVHIEIV